MKFTLDIRMENTEGVLERVLGKLRQRGYRVQAMNSACSIDDKTVDARMIIESSRPADLAARHIAKLYDVIYVVANPLEEGHGHGTGEIPDARELRIPVRHYAS